MTDITRYTYTMRGWDAGANQYVTWQSQDTPDLTPVATTPPLIGPLQGVFVEDVQESVPSSLPAGGAANQILRKISNADFNAQWTEDGLAPVVAALATKQDANIHYELATSGYYNENIAYQDDSDKLLQLCIGVRNDGLLDFVYGAITDGII